MLSVLAALLFMTSCVLVPADGGRPGKSRPFFRTMLSDVASGPGTLFRDTKNAVTDRDVLLPLGVVGGLAALTKNSGSRTDDYFFKNDILSDRLSEGLDYCGSGELLLGSTALWYMGSLALGEEKSYQDSKIMFRSLAATGVVNTLLKGAFNDTRPDGGPFGFPSGHSSMAMATAATLQDLYGYKAGIPAFIAAGMVGLQRLDESRHDVGDVLFGWTLGYVIAHSIAGARPIEVMGLQLGVHVEPDLDFVGFSLSLP